jgi:hypothetical protein
MTEADNFFLDLLLVMMTLFLWIYQQRHCYLMDKLGHKSKLLFVGMVSQGA